MKLATFSTGAAFAVILAATAAQAAPHHRDRDWHRHEVYAHHYWHGRPNPRVVYAPPVVYEPPPPVEESPGLSLVIPINIH